MKVTIANTPLTIEGDAAEISELIDHMTAGRIELSVNGVDVPPARTPGHAAGPRPRCAVCGRNHQDGKCKATSANGRAAVTS